MKGKIGQRVCAPLCIFIVLSLLLCCVLCYGCERTSDVESTVPVVPPTESEDKNPADSTLPQPPEEGSADDPNFTPPEEAEKPEELAPSRFAGMWAGWRIEIAETGAAQTAECVLIVQEDGALKSGSYMRYADGSEKDLRDVRTRETDTMLFVEAEDCRMEFSYDGETLCGAGLTLFRDGDKEAFTATLAGRYESEDGMYVLTVTAAGTQDENAPDDTVWLAYVVGYTLHVYDEYDNARILVFDAEEGTLTFTDTRTVLRRAEE